MAASSFGLPYVLFVFRLIVILVISHFDFNGGSLVLIVSVPGYCLPFAFCKSKSPIQNSFWPQNIAYRPIFKMLEVLMRAMLGP